MESKMTHEEFTLKATEFRDNIWNQLKDQEDKVILACLCGNLMQLAEKTPELVFAIDSALDHTKEGLKMLAMQTMYDLIKEKKNVDKQENS